MSPRRAVLAFVLAGAAVAAPPAFAAPLHTFSADAPMMSDAEVYRDGEYVFQDYVLDDHGANTDTLNRTDLLFGAGYEPGNPLDPFNPGSSGGQIRHAGDYMYPGADDFYFNVADLAEFRVAQTPSAVVYRFELGALDQPDDAVIGMCVDEDRDRATGLAQWPLGARVDDALGCDRFYTVFGTGAKLTDGAGTTTDLPAADVQADTAANTIELRVPRTLADPGTATWRYTIGSGLWDAGAGTWQDVPPLPSQPAAATPTGGDPAGAAPQLYDLLSNRGETNSYWREERQANDLSKQQLGDHHVEVDFARMADPRDDADPRRTGVVQRIYRARHSVAPGEGITVNNLPTRNYTYHGDLQPYTVAIPSTFYTQLAADPGKRFQFDQCLHPLNGNQNVEVYYQEVHAQPMTTPTPVVADGPGSNLGFDEFQARVDRQNVVYACVNGRSENVGYTGGIGTVDAKEVQREVEARYPIDPERNILHGISLGSIGTWYMTMLDPDRYAGAVNAIFTPGFSTSNPRLKNLLHVPTYMAIGSGDEFGQAAVADAVADQSEALGNEYVYEQLATREHELSIEHEILPFTERLIYPRRRKADPARVRYQADPARHPAAVPDDGAVYWVSGMAPRTKGTPADIDVTSLGRADELPRDRVTFLGLYKNDGLGRQSRFRGQFNLTPGEFGQLFRPEDFQPGWQKLSLDVRHESLTQPKVANGFALESTNLGSAAFDTGRMKLDTGKALTGTLKGDGPLSLTLLGSFPRATTATLDGRPVAVERSEGALRLALEVSGADPHTLVISPADAGGVAGATGSQTPGGGAGAGDGGAATAACDDTSGLRGVAATRRGTGFRLAFTRTAAATGPATVDLFQVSTGRRVLRERRVARFTRRSGAFAYAANRLRDGYYFARISVPTKTGRDTRRVTLRRSGGRFSARPGFHRRASCGLLRSFKLTRPVFGGTGRRSAGVSYRVGEPAEVSIAVLRGSRTVRRIAARTRPAGGTFRVTLGREARRRGDYKVRITVRRGGRSVTSTLTTRRL